MSGTSDGLQRFIQNSYNDTEHFYVCFVGTLLRDNCYEPFDIAPKNILTNFLTLGGWLTYNPQYLAIMEDRGITNPMRAAVDSDTVLMFTPQPDLTAAYLSYQLGQSVRLEEISLDELHICDDICAYRAYTTD